MSDWVFDSLICFLHSPVWNAALNTFIEEKSLVFDPNIEIDISDPQYLEIHNEYKNLVDYMLGSFMEELNITPEEFELACIEGKNLLTKNDPSNDNGSFSFHKGLFQQIWAANDMRTFVKLMVQRNIEIQLQALDLIERQRNSQDVDDIETQEREEIAEIEESVKVEVNHQEQEKQEDESLNRLNLFFEKEKVDKEDLNMRQAYLRQQRDKILQLKKQVRARQLDDTTMKERPKSAKAAQKIIRGENIEPDEASIQLRKILAKKLRDEVVDSSQN
ncbi:unnamed protein product [Chironomus riparius]|uniref:Cilia- and flagella-associated protein 36 n=1 Tax=Chironomus riparius TaxID=315576 RepID=A0A9N9WX44_9DIPT|nr:unnamed protein product [Chironomus riparius]